MLIILAIVICAISPVEFMEPIASVSLRPSSASIRYSSIIRIRHAACRGEKAAGMRNDKAASTASTSAGFSTHAFAHVESQPVAAIVPDRGEAVAAFNIFTAGIDRQGNNYWLVPGMGAWHQLADCGKTS